MAEIDNLVINVEVTGDTDKLGGLANDIEGVGKKSQKSTNKVNAFGLSIKNMLKGAAFIQTMRYLGTAVNKSMEYTESLNLFTVAMGDYANEAKKYAETVSEIMGIDPAEWLKAQGTFNILATGFGVAADKAAIMSKNLTQLGYDISSFYNISVNDAMLKLQSGFSGELEPLRRLGYDLSQARLQQEAYALGIDKSVTAMTQAEKSMLRYHAIMSQVTEVQGDMARTLESPANQTRILKAQVTQLTRSIGNILIPVINKLLPYLIALARFAREAADSIARFFGFTLPEVDYSSATDSVGNIVTDLEEANDSAKELKRTLMGFDEINKLNAPTSGSSSGSTGGGVGFDMELLEYDFLGDVVEKSIPKIKLSFNDLWNSIYELGTPIESWFGEDAKVFYETFVSEAQRSFEELYTRVSTIFSDLWEIAIKPSLDKITTDGIPIMSQFGTEVVDLWSVVTHNIGVIADFVWVGAVGKTLSLITTIFTDAVDIISKNWEQYGEPVFDGIETAINNTKTLILTLWEQYLRPIWNGIVSAITELWENHLKPLSDNIAGFVGELILTATTIYNNFIAPVVNYFAYVLAPTIRGVFESIKNFIAPIVGNIIDILSGIITAAKGVLQFIRGVFSGDWKTAWEGIKTTFSGVWDSMKSAVKIPLNFIIGLINKLLTGAFSAAGTLVRAINNISFQVPDWVPGIGGEEFGINISLPSAPQIPTLASGGQVEAGNLFIAQEAGPELVGAIGRKTTVANNQQIVDGIYKGVYQAMRDVGGNNGGQRIIVMLPNGDVLGETVVNWHNGVVKQTGNTPLLV